MKLNPTKLLISLIIDFKRIDDSKDFTNFQILEINHDKIFYNAINTLKLKKKQSIMAFYKEIKMIKNDAINLIKLLNYHFLNTLTW